MLFSGCIFSPNTGFEIFSHRKLASLASFRQAMGFARDFNQNQVAGALIKFLDLESGRLFEVGANSRTGD